MTNDDFRNPTDTERAILGKLLDVDFRGRAELDAQLADVRVQSIDENGSLKIRVRDDAPMAPVLYRTPVEAQTTDADGVTVVITLHVTNGRASELEIIRADSGSLVAPLDPSRFSIVTMP
jgi:uncharacterized protein DUF6984